jgi:arabinan endo-1,5-alpha-L-arabinosidase
MYAFVLDRRETSMGLISWLTRARLVAALVVAVVTVLGVAAPAGAATQQPVDTHPTADPGVTLYNGNFYAFTTSTSSEGFGLWESKAPMASGPWTAATGSGTAPSNEFSTASVPSWIKTSGGVWAPDMVLDPSTGDFVVYFTALLNPAAFTGTRETPAPGARCIGAAVAEKPATGSASPTGPFRIQPNPVVCLKGYGAADDMTGDPGDRLTGEGAIDPGPVIINNSWDNNTNELFLLYKTQSPNTGQATIRMVRVDMTTDGTTQVSGGESHQLLVPTPTGSGGSYPFSDTIEGPSLLSLPNGYFVLFVAHGNFNSCDYSTEYFVSQHPWSWTQNGGTTVLSQSSTGLCGPGGASVTGAEVSGQYRLFFHAYASGTAGTAREMYADVLTLGSDGHTPVLTPLTPAS